MNQIHSSLSLEGQRIILRPLRVSDAEEVYKNWASDPEVSKYMFWNTHENTDVTREWLASCEECMDDKDAYNWGIVIRDTGELIGSIGASKSKEDDRYTVGYCIGRKYWRNGYTPEALRCMLDYLVTKEGIHHFVADHAVMNPASGAVMMKAGFVYFGEGNMKSFDGKREFPTKIYHWDAP
jgi:ribosomal-protein-alanine N-acetyltransferase